MVKWSRNRDTIAKLNERWQRIGKKFFFVQLVIFFWKLLTRCRRKVKFLELSVAGVQQAWCHLIPVVQRRAAFMMTMNVMNSMVRSAHDVLYWRYFSLSKNSNSDYVRQFTAVRCHVNLSVTQPPRLYKLFSDTATAGCRASTVNTRRSIAVAYKAAPTHARQN